MNTNHTPGPWRKEYDYGAYNIEADAPGEPGKTHLVAAAVSDRDVPILLAAPDLLQALQNLIAWHDADHNDSRSAIDKARAAIAKATGIAT